MVYLPRTVDQVGRIIKASLAISKDGIHFEPYRDEINWPNDPKKQSRWFTRCQSQSYSNAYY